LASARISDVDLASRVQRLTAGQRECLDLVDDHATSKEIARQLGISRHTVDARLRGAIQTLGVRSRREAAVIYRAAAQAEAYQPFTYQPPRIVTGLRTADNGGHEDADSIGLGGSESGDARSHAFPEREPLAGIPAAADQAFGHGAIAAQQGSPRVAHMQRPESGMVADSAVWTAVGTADFGVPRSSLRLWGGANDLSPTQRVAGILIVTILAMLAFGVFLSGIEALTLLRS
jgi:DNA-binding CsgD family transcriptional regulator